MRRDSRGIGGTCALYYSFSENKGADQLQGSASLFSYMQNVVFLSTRLIYFSFHDLLHVHVYYIQSSEIQENSVALYIVYFIFSLVKI